MNYLNNDIRTTTCITIITHKCYDEGILKCMGWPWLDARCSLRHSRTLLLAKIGRGENKMEKSLVCHDKGNLTKQKLHMEAKV